MERKWAVIVAAVLGVLAVILTNVYLQKQEATSKPAPTKQAQVVVAATDITKGATVEYEMLALQLMPVTFIQPGALKARESAVGKTAMATIMAGEQVLSTKLTTPGTGLTLAAKTPPGKRAFTLSLAAASAVGGMLKPGDHVDVLAIFAEPPVTLTLFQDVLILAMGQEMIMQEEGRVGRVLSKAAAATSKEQEAVTLALSPQQVQILTVAMEQGRITLTLRPPMEAEEPFPTVDLSNLPSVVDINTLLQLYISQPDITPTGSNVEVIRGLKRELTPVPTTKK